MSRNRNTFTTFLKAQKHRQDPVGELARDWSKDVHNSKPRGAYKWKTLEGYLLGRGAVQNCISAAKLAWDEWQYYVKTDSRDSRHDDSLSRTHVTHSKTESYRGLT
jgi:hypothetical protein